MPELSGMEFSRMVSEKTRIIFTTAFEQYVLDSYKVNALDYLLKPISYADFLQSTQKALQWVKMFNNRQNPPTESGKHEPESIFIKTERRLVQINLNQILYIEGLKRQCENLYRRVGKSDPLIDEYESNGRIAAAEQVRPRTSFIHRTA